MSSAAAPMITINRADPLPTRGEPLDPILRRKLIKYPYPRIEEQQIALPEYRAIIKTTNNWRNQIEAQQIADEITTFERTHLGKSSPSIQIPIVTPDHQVLQKVQQFQPPTETTLLDYDQPPAQVFSRSTIVTAKTRFLNCPAAWNSLDEPLMPARPSVRPTLDVRQARPFTQLRLPDTRFGIPLCTSELIKTQKRKMAEYHNSVRFLETCDNQVQEERVKERMRDERNALLTKHEETLKVCARLGQEWATGQGRRLLAMKRRKEPEPMSKEDEEAMRALKKRDDDLMDEYREKKKEMMQRDQQAALLDTQGT
jgi:hypothetical protein